MWRKHEASRSTGTAKTLKSSLSRLVRNVKRKLHQAIVGNCSLLKEKRFVMKQAYNFNDLHLFKNYKTNLSGELKRGYTVQKTVWYIFCCYIF